MNKHQSYWPLYILLFLGLYFSSCKKDDQLIVKYDVKVELLDKLNKLRSAGCKCGTDTMYATGILSWNDTLEKAADNHVTDMVARNYFSHISPDGFSAIQRARTEGYAGQMILEDIARGYNSVTEVIYAWKQSEDHCKAMMDTSINEVGASRVNEYWVMDLGKKQ